MKIKIQANNSLKIFKSRVRLKNFKIQKKLSVHNMKTNINSQLNQKPKIEYEIITIELQRLNNN